MEYNRPSMRIVDDEQDFPAAKLKGFVRYHVGRGTDYATAFAKACGPYYDLRSLEKRFDYEWDKETKRTRK